MGGRFRHSRRLGVAMGFQQPRPSFAKTPSPAPVNPCASTIPTPSRKRMTAPPQTAALLRQAREARRAAQAAAAADARTVLRRESDWMARQPKARSTKSRRGALLGGLFLGLGFSGLKDWGWGFVGAAQAAVPQEQARRPLGGLGVSGLGLQGVPGACDQGLDFEGSVPRRVSACVSPHARPKPPPRRRRLNPNRKPQTETFFTHQGPRREPLNPEPNHKTAIFSFRQGPRRQRPSRTPTPEPQPKPQPFCFFLPRARARIASF